MDKTGVLTNAESAVANVNAAGVRFVIQQLALGLSDCEMASNADTEQNARFLEECAGRSYRSAMLHVKSLSLTGDEQIAFDQREFQLRRLLAEFA